MSLATAKIGSTVSPPLSGAMEDCSIVRGPLLQRLCRQNCCMSRQRRMFGSLWSIVVVHEHRRQDGSRRLSTLAKCQTATLLCLLCQDNVSTLLPVFEQCLSDTPATASYDTLACLLTYCLTDVLIGIYCARTMCRHCCRCLSNVCLTHQPLRAMTHLLTYCLTDVLIGIYCARTMCRHCCRCLSNVCLTRRPLRATTRLLTY